MSSSDQISEISEIARICDDYVTASIKLSPIASTNLGVTGLDDQLDDFSLAHAGQSADLLRETIAKIKVSDPINDYDRIAKDVALERMQSSLALH
ncbi:MAG: hypothetical protein O2896_00005, partial [Actinomycetota bacterium]|nr:hypothetical protein [Actinomycetota bacterium]